MLGDVRWLLVLVLIGCVSPVKPSGGRTSAKRAQREQLHELLPVALSTEGPWRGPIVDAKIRVYADDEFRTQNLDWHRTFDETLEYANAVLGPSFGVRLVPDYREWEHHAPGNSLEDDLKELERLDDGGDALTVVGLTSSLSLVSATFEQLGYADVPGRHMMLRGYADLVERNAFKDAFPDLSRDERERAHDARRRHKVAALLLHELGHNLGAPHESADDTLMSPNYSRTAAAFSAEAHATIQRTLDQRLGRSAD